MTTSLQIDWSGVERFCHRWRIIELELFGSALRDDFGAGSDIDLLVSFAPDAQWSLWDHITMEQELSGILGRRVDLVSREAVEQSSNWIRRKAILESAQSLYVAR